MNNELTAVATPHVNSFGEQIYNIGIAWRDMVIKEKYLLRPVYSQEAAQRKCRKLQKDLDAGLYDKNLIEAWKSVTEGISLLEIYKLLKEINALVPVSYSIELFDDGSGILKHGPVNYRGWPVEIEDRGWDTLRRGELLLKEVLKCESSKRESSE